MKFLATLKRELKRHLTVMVIPHNTIRPLRLHFTTAFLLLMLTVWTGVTLWAGYLSSRHIDYWRVASDNQLLKVKMMFFSHQVKKSQELLEQVKENDDQLRALLQMKSKKDIIEAEGKGGPTPEESIDLSRELSGTIYEVSQQDIQRQTARLHETAKKRIESYNEIMDYVKVQRSIAQATPSQWPCIGHVTSTFGMRLHPVYNAEDFHSGLDIANFVNTPVYATAYGTVAIADWQSGYGRLIVIDHGHGYKTYYGHLHKILVKPGEEIKRGQLIGLMGDTGTSTGNHLHYEIQYNGRSTNPTRFLKKNVSVAAQNAAR